MSILLTFRCGHRQPWKDGHAACCVQCGSTTVVRSTARPPSFVGRCTGPLATTKDLEPSAAAFVEHRLTLTDQKGEDHD